MSGTFNVYAARPARVVLCSTMGVYGHAVEQPASITEATPVSPRDVYGLSKALSEDLARYHARVEAIPTVALRLGMFVPETFERYGFRLLFGGVDVRDVAQAVGLALEHEPLGGFDCFDVMAETPFKPGDVAELAAAPETLLGRHWPGTLELAAQHGLDLGELVWGATLWPIEKAKRVLGFAPRHGFAEFLDAFRRGDSAYYPSAGETQWGL
ncbi:MAG: NAD(P)-dependent oxidoreductase [Gaiellaceae bacterium MAG52_C11]|nr:NAD(P)-dependent oxidoreductase [Candidatus Gaiellasilicea maunaloa]